MRPRIKDTAGFKAALSQTRAQKEAVRAYEKGKARGGPAMMVDSMDDTNASGAGANVSSNSE